MKRSQNSLVLELLADGQPHHHHELYELHVVAHSRVADLRRFGYAIRTWQAPDPRTGERLHWYELQRVPVDAPAIERTLGERARADLEVLRRTRPAGSAQGPAAVPGPGAAACHASTSVGEDSERAAVAQSVERDVANVEVAGSRPASRFSTDATERVDASTTPEGAGGWRQPRHPELMGDGSHRQESGTDGPSDGVRAETRREEGRVGGDPGSAPAAVEQQALFDAPPGGGMRPDREYQSERFVCRPDLEAELELQAVEQELAAAAEWGASDPERVEQLEGRARELNDRLFGARGVAA